MSDKEISITPNRILVRHKETLLGGKFGSWWTTKFDTDLQYLKTDPVGQLKAGGYEKCPTFYGSGADPAVGISDKDNGWWPTDLVAGAFDYARTSDILLDVPAWTSRKVYMQNTSFPSAYSYNAAYSAYYSYSKTLYIGDIGCGSFRWMAQPIVVGTADNGEGGTYDVYNLAVMPIEVILTQPDLSGVLRFPWQDIGTWTGSYQDGDTGQYISTNFYSAHNYDADGTRAWRFPSPVWNSWCLMFTKDPVTLSLAVTP